MLLVFEHIPRVDRQVVLLSATIPADLFRDMTQTIMNGNPIKILVKRGQLTLEGIRQFFILMEKEDWKLDTLCDLYTTETFTHPTVVFCNSRKKVDALVTQLEARELTALATVRTLYVRRLNLHTQLSRWAIILHSMAEKGRGLVSDTSRSLGLAHPVF